MWPISRFPIFGWLIGASLAFKIACCCSSLQSLKLHLTADMHTVLAAVMHYSLSNLHLTKHNTVIAAIMLFYFQTCFCCDTLQPLKLHSATHIHSAYCCNTLQLLNYIYIHTVILYNLPAAAMFEAFKTATQSNYCYSHIMPYSM